MSRLLASNTERFSTNHSSFRTHCDETKPEQFNAYVQQLKQTATSKSKAAERKGIQGEVAEDVTTHNAITGNYAGAFPPLDFEGGRRGAIF